MKFDHPMTIRRLGRIVVALEGKPMHVHQIADAIYLSKRWVPKYMDHLCAENKAHICDWVRHGNHLYPIAQYAAGAGRNIPKPDPLTTVEKSRQRRARINADMDRRDAYLARDRMRRNKPVIDPLMAAFYGMSQGVSDAA